MQNHWLFSCNNISYGSAKKPNDLKKIKEDALTLVLVLGDAVSKVETFVWILTHIPRSITWSDSLFTLKASYLVKWSISTWSFMCWCQFIDWLKFETRPVPCWISDRPIEHGHPRFLLQNWSSHMMNIQWTKLKRKSIVTFISEELP